MVLGLQSCTHLVISPEAVGVDQYVLEPDQTHCLASCAASSERLRLTHACRSGQDRSMTTGKLQGIKAKCYSSSVLQEKCLPRNRSLFCLFQRSRQSEPETSNSRQESPAEKDQDQSKESRPVRLQRQASKASQFHAPHDRRTRVGTAHCQRTPIPWVCRAAAFPIQGGTARRPSSRAARLCPPHLLPVPPQRTALQLQDAYAHQMPNRARCTVPTVHVHPKTRINICLQLPRRACAHLFEIGLELFEVDAGL